MQTTYYSNPLVTKWIYHDWYCYSFSKENTVNSAENLRRYEWWRSGPKGTIYTRHTYSSQILKNACIWRIFIPKEILYEIIGSIPSRTWYNSYSSYLIWHWKYVLSVQVSFPYSAKLWISPRILLHFCISHGFSVVKFTLCLAKIMKRMGKT